MGWYVTGSQVWQPHACLTAPCQVLSMRFTQPPLEGLFVRITKATHEQHALLTVCSPYALFFHTSTGMSSSPEAIHVQDTRRLPPVNVWVIMKPHITGWDGVFKKATQVTHMLGEGHITIEGRGRLGF